MKMGIGLGLGNFRTVGSGGGDPTGDALDTLLAPASIIGQSLHAAADVVWSNPENVLADNASAATWVMPSTTGNSQFLKVAFAAPSLPANAKITGIEVRVRIIATTNMAIRQAYLTFDGELCNKQAWVPDVSILNGVLTTVTFGGPGDTFGTTLGAADLNAGRIGFAFRCGRGGGGSGATISAQYVDMKVYYTTLEGIVSRGAAVATVTLPNDGAAIPSKRHRAAFPVGMGTPKAIIWAAVAHAKSNRSAYNVRAVNVPSAFMSVGMATPLQAGGGESKLNNAGTFVGRNSTSHNSKASPNIGGFGTSTSDEVVGFGTNGAKPVAWGDGYVDFEFEIVGGSPFYFTAMALYPTSAHLYLGDGFVRTPREETRVINCGFQPNMFLTVSIADTYNTAEHDAYAEVQIGGGKWDGTGWTNLVATWNASTRTYVAGSSTERALVRNRLALLNTASHFSNNTNDDFLGAGGYSEIFYQRRLIARSATGYTIETMLDNSINEDNVTVLALDWGSVPFDIGFVDLPAATGAGTIASTFRPSAIFAALTNATGLGQIVDVDAETRAYSVFQASDTHGATHGWVSPNGVNPLNATSMTDIDGARVIETAGTTSFAAKVARMKNAGVELDVTATPGARKALALIVG